MSTTKHSISRMWSGLKSDGHGVLKSLGIVFGDIGTSPLYTLTTIFHLLPKTEQNIFGVISLIIWTLILLVFVQYAWLAMGLGRKGEGGMIVLKELLVPLLKNPAMIAAVTLLSFIGISLFIGDGVITPAVSILSSVEGIVLIPCFKSLSDGVIMLIAAIICILLFIFQSRGTEKVGSTFGPIMLIWFSTIMIFGAIAIFLYPAIFYAINPYYAVHFLMHHGYISFFVLAAVILCATGGEALYADMGHLGRKPILKAWYFVFVSLVLCYLGQGAFLMYTPLADRVFQEMIFHLFPIAYIPFLVLSVAATVIASQALISAIFSVFYQGIATHIMPRIKIGYTSSKLRSQVYIGFVNWTLLAAVLFMIFNFQKSDNLTNAYGVAVAGTMLITSIMMTLIFYLKHNYFKSLLSAFLIFINILFFGSTLLKLPAGGYWSIVIAFFPLAIILIYTMGQKRLYSLQQPQDPHTFLTEFITSYQDSPKLEGTALFFVRDLKAIQSYVVQTVFEKHIIYEDNVLVAVVTRDEPFGVMGVFKGGLTEGLRIFEIHRGYMEIIDIEKILENAGIEPQVIFYGLEAIVTKNVFWKIYAAIKQLSPSFVQFYKLPPEKLHGIVSLVEM